MGFLSDLIRRQLPDYVIDNDSYKDINKKGFVERYLSIFGAELDEYYYDQIDKIVDQVDPLNTGNVLMLDLIAGGLGDLPNISKNSDHYRRILVFITSIWRIKGTKQSYKSLLYTVGCYNTDIVEVPLVGSSYDDGVTFYDDGVSFYDGNCPTCSEYDIITTGPALTDEIHQAILNLVVLVEPINAKLRNLIYNEEVLTHTFDDTFDDTFDTNA